MATIGVDFGFHGTMVDEERVKVLFALGFVWDSARLFVFQMQIWDTSGQDRFRSITSAYYRGAHVRPLIHFAMFLLFTFVSFQAIMLVYDVTDPEAFTSLRNWVEQVEDHAPENVVLMVVGNKRDSLDTEPAVPTAQAHAFAEQIGAAFMEVSAKTGAGVNEAFMQIAEEVVDELRLRPPQPQAPARANPVPGKWHRKAAFGIATVAFLVGCWVVW